MDYNEQLVVLYGVAKKLKAFVLIKSSISRKKTLRRNNSPDVPTPYPGQAEAIFH